MVLSLAERARLLEMSVVLSGVGRHEDAELLIRIASRDSAAAVAREKPSFAAIRTDISCAIDRLEDKALMAFALAAGWRFERAPAEGEESAARLRWLSPQGRAFIVVACLDGPNIACDELRAAMRESLVPQSE